MDLVLNDAAIAHCQFNRQFNCQWLSFKDSTWHAELKLCCRK